MENDYKNKCATLASLKHQYEFSKADFEQRIKHYQKLENKGKPVNRDDDMQYKQLQIEVKKLRQE